MGFIFLFFLFCIVANAQEKIMDGIVFDKYSKARLNRVNIYNPRLQQAVYNNTKAEFSIKAKNGDIIICTLAGYKTDTFLVANQTSIIVFLKRLAIPLAQVTVKDTVLSAQAKYENTKKQFHNLYRLGNNNDVFSIGPNGAGISIDALWSTFSREGRNARHLMEIMERDYQNQVIDQRFNAKIVQRETGLIGEKLLRFLISYRPSYFFAVRASEYEFLSYINLAFNKFKTNPYYYNDFSLLKPIKLN
ncbi:MAG: hypothetical protein EAZ51_07860 [Sphingobacteriales bacterium]|nr:MAG: hypothetical protein EAZ64_05580 [Sphingobacteriales bacterium]TAF79346.1 MAG: hypothetical protein EAZ51_07860 [Sphingobacteriales bacterium]